jgi:hypothetical protein
VIEEVVDAFKESGCSEQSQIAIEKPRLYSMQTIMSVLVTPSIGDVERFAQHF